jgi:hypothetical protein
LNVHGVGDAGQMEIHTVKPLVPEPSPFEVEIALQELKRHKLPDIIQIPAGGETLHSEIHNLINSIWNKEELPQQWKESISVPICRKGDKLTIVIIEAYHCHKLRRK